MKEVHANGIGREGRRSKQEREREIDTEGRRHGRKEGGRKDHHVYNPKSRLSHLFILFSLFSLSQLLSGTVPPFRSISFGRCK